MLEPLDLIKAIVDNLTSRRLIPLNGSLKSGIIAHEY